MKPARLIKLIASVICLLLTAGCAAEPKQHVNTDFVMDTFVMQQWHGEKAEQTCNEIVHALKEAEKRLSLFEPESEISKLNQAAGKHPVALSDETYSLLKEAALYCGQSGGVFDITIAPLTLVWDITAAEPEIPSDGEIEEARGLVGYRDIVFDDEDRTAMLKREGMSIDLGGIAKGYAAGITREIAEKNNVEGYVSIGGNIMMHGKKPDGSDFVIGVRDPRGAGSEYIATVSFDGLIMATTGDYERYFEKDGVRYHHIIDPFTGRPSESDLISVTVFAENGTLADCLSTLIFLRGSEGLGEFLNRGDCMVAAVTKELDVYVSPALQGKLRPNTAKPQYDFIYQLSEET